VIITARDTVAFDGVASNGFSSGAFSNVEQGVKGNGGDINITTGSLAVTGGAQLSATTLGEGKAGSVIITARDTVAFDGVASNGFSSGAFSNVEQGGKGNGGTINITTGSLAVTGGAGLSASTFGEGKAGSVIITARDTVAFDGVGSDGFSSGVFSFVGEEAKGDGGTINITTGSLAVTGGARLNASTFGEGKAGSVIITASDTVAFDGVGSDGFSSGVFSFVGEGAKGDGGDINIVTKSLAVTNGAQVNVSSLERTGDAGNIYIRGGSIYLDKGTFRADSVSGMGGDVLLQAQDLLLLRHNSQISAISGTTDAGGYGGNFDIDALFIVAVPSENSDIITNAFTGIGGNIRIAAQGGIFGAQFRQQLTPKSDIVATGTVQLYTPNTNPSQGLVALPTTPVDRTNQIDQGCSAGGTNWENKFTVSGRGGLPSTPNELLSPDMVQDDFGTLATETQTRSDATPTPQPTNSPKQLVEAQGWIIASDGKVILTATGPNATPQQGWQIPTNCQVSQPSSNAVQQ
jgi:large exoprotein involved in heme utilization and adhesion